ncbi:MAG: hypothetical protein IIB56_17110 [Planctomycetes bacterium]|nr:hypothetical protein [Planctomycetota bacterium]
MNSYIFITTEGYTFQPESESIEPDIENCQVIGFAKGKNPKQAFQNMIQENSNLLETTFDELICYELKDYDEKSYFYLNAYKVSEDL